MIEPTIGRECVILVLENVFSATTPLEYRPASVKGEEIDVNEIAGVLASEESGDPGHNGTGQCTKVIDDQSLAAVL